MPQACLSWGSRAHPPRAKRPQTGHLWLLQVRWGLTLGLWSCVGAPGQFSLNSHALSLCSEVRSGLEMGRWRPAGFPLQGHMALAGWL